MLKTTAGPQDPLDGIEELVAHGVLDGVSVPSESDGLMGDMKPTGNTQNLEL